MHRVVAASASENYRCFSSATRETFVFKAVWLNTMFAPLGQSWRCRWERLTSTCIHSLTERAN
jgi:hypothetical protein